MATAQLHYKIAIFYLGGGTPSLELLFKNVCEKCIGVQIVLCIIIHYLNDSTISIHLLCGRNPFSNYYLIDESDKQDAVKTHDKTVQKTT